MACGLKFVMVQRHCYGAATGLLWCGNRFVVMQHRCAARPSFDASSDATSALVPPCSDLARRVSCATIGRQRRQSAELNLQRGCVQATHPALVGRSRPRAHVSMRGQESLPSVEPPLQALGYGSEARKTRSVLEVNCERGCVRAFACAAKKRL